MHMRLLFFVADDSFTGVIPDAGTGLVTSETRDEGIINLILVNEPLSEVTIQVFSNNKLKIWTKSRRIKTSTRPTFQTFNSKDKLIWRIKGLRL